MQLLQQATEKYEHLDENNDHDDPLALTKFDHYDARRTFRASLVNRHNLVLREGS